MRSHPFAIGLVLISMLYAVGLPPAARAAGRKPNVILIFTDDQGSIDANCYGAKDLTTPGIDLLASRGVRFTQFYAAAPVCSPSRAGLLTGRYPWLAGMPTNGSPPPSEEINDLNEIKQQSRGGEWAREITMAEMFKAAGYATGHVGKWHLHYGPGERPLEQGFDYSFGHMDGCIDNYTHFFYWAGHNRHDLWEGNTRVRMPGKFFPDLMVEKATAFIEKNKDKPFLLSFASNLPHYPYQGDNKWIEHYKAVPYPRNLYNAFMSPLDERVKQLVEVVDRLKLTENTIIIYQSDNGHSTEERAHGGGGSAGPYRGAKFSLFEGGIRLPAIICWPGRLPKGVTRDQVAHSCDWLPTLAALCDVKLPEAKLHGRSLVDVIRSDEAKSPHDALHWQVGNQWAVRQGSWKLIHNVNAAGTEPKLEAGDRPMFLANLESDPGERTNLAAKHPDMVKRLQSLHDALK